jgi:AcrR family transcriptional regulator
MPPRARRSAATRPQAAASQEPPTDGQAKPRRSTQRSVTPRAQQSGTRKPEAAAGEPPRTRTTPTVLPEPASGNPCLPASPSPRISPSPRPPVSPGPGVPAPPLSRSPAPDVPTTREEQVYRAALRLFREKGYHATSMQDIAEAVGLYKGSLYHYIGGKEELLARTFERAMRALLGEMERIVADTRLAPTEQLRRAIRSHVAAVANNLDALTVYLHEWRALADESLANVRAQRERYAELFAEIIARGVRAGEFHARDARLTALGLLGMCNWLSQWYRPGGRLRPKEIADHFADVVLNGLLGGRAINEPGAPSGTTKRDAAGETECEAEGAAKRDAVGETECDTASASKGEEIRPRVH